MVVSEQFLKSEAILSNGFDNVYLVAFFVMIHDCLVSIVMKCRQAKQKFEPGFFQVLKVERQMPVSWRLCI